MIDNFRFSPIPLTVAVGSMVTWLNHDDIPHSIVVPTITKISGNMLDTASRRLADPSQGTPQGFAGMTDSAGAASTTISLPREKRGGIFLELRWSIRRMMQPSHGTPARASPHLTQVRGSDSRLVVEVAVLTTVLVSAVAIIASLCGCVLLTPYEDARKIRNFPQNRLR